MCRSDKTFIPDEEKEKKISSPYHLKLQNIFFQAKRILLGIFIIGLVSLIIIPHISYAQSPPLVKITGRVTDASTGEPLYFVNVFLSNTTLGCATDKNGVFSIENIPPSTYELVVSMMGYELQAKTIQLKGPTERKYNFKLKSKPIQAPEITVSAPYPHEWKKNLKNFERLFLGTSHNASRCKIFNPEILDFTFDKTTHVFTATAREPLQIENQALGYRIFLFLEDFSSSDNASVRFLYKSRFESLPPRDKKEEERWRGNRLKAYHGSLKHFLVSLVSNRLEEEGFFVNSIEDLSRIDENIHANRVTADTLLSPRKLFSERKLSFSNYLRVIYEKEEEDQEYIMGRRHKAHMQTSWLRTNIDSVSIDALGHTDNPYALTTFGYMAWERMAEALPLDYTPPIQSKY
jgi:hypothetical protein